MSGLVLDILQRLMEGIVQCASGLGWEKGEDECMNIGNRLAEEATRHMLPRLIVQFGVSFGGVNQNAGKIGPRVVQQMHLLPLLQNILLLPPHPHEISICVKKNN